MDDQQINPSITEGSVLEQANSTESEAILVKKISQQGKLRQLLWMVVVFAVSGALTGIALEDGKFSRICDFASAVAFVILILRWCEYDRWERRLAPWRFFTPLMVLFPGPLIMVPTYLIKTRGVEGLFATAKAFAFFLMLIAVFIVTTIVSDYLFM